MGTTNRSGRIVSFVAQHPRVLIVALLVTLLLVAGAGEVAAHNPAGIAPGGCENGADIVAHKNPNCHG